MARRRIGLGVLGLLLFSFGPAPDVARAQVTCGALAPIFAQLAELFDIDPLIFPNVPCDQLTGSPPPGTGPPGPTPSTTIAPNPTTTRPAVTTSTTANAPVVPAAATTTVLVRQPAPLVAAEVKPPAGQGGALSRLLARTGVEIVAMVGIAGGLIATGIVLARGARRRRPAPTSS